MARVDFRTPEPWLNHYRNTGSAPGSDRYGPWLQPFADERFRRLTAGPLLSNGLVLEPHPISIAKTDRILIAGCGAGYLIASFLADGFSETFGLDYAQSEVELLVPAPVAGRITWHDAGGNLAQLKNALRDTSGARTFDWIVTEDVATCYDLGAELDGLLDAAEEILTAADLARIMHLVTPLQAANVPQDSSFLIQSVDAWEAVRPAHRWIGLGSWELR
jgi:hypothetical protein